MLLTLLNRDTGEAAYYHYSEWQSISKGKYGDIKGWKKTEPIASYAYLKDYFAYDIHPLCLRQMAHGDEPLVGDDEEWICIRIECEDFGLIWERPRDEIDTYHWQRYSGDNGLPDNFVRPSNTH